MIAELATAAEAGLVASSSGRYRLAAAWDQNAGLYVLSPAAAVVEEVAGGWLAELLGLPAEVSVGFATGAQMANLTGLAAALTDSTRCSCTSRAHQTRSRTTSRVR